MKSEPQLAERVAGTLFGLGVGSAIARDGVGSDAPIARHWDANEALAHLTAQELLEDEVDLQRLVRRWLDWYVSGERSCPGSAGVVLEGLAKYQGPGGHRSPCPGLDALAWCLPIAVAAHGSPTSLVSGTYHTAFLIHGDEQTAWAAVALNVAAARFLLGKRDFIPDVIDVLRTNGAPQFLTTAIRRIPFLRRSELVLPGPRAADVIHCVTISLWTAHHEPSFEAALRWLSGSRGHHHTTLAVTAAILGARDGASAIPPGWLARVAGLEMVRQLAGRMVTSFNGATSSAGSGA